MAFGPDGDLYVANYSGDDVAHFGGPSAANPGGFIGTFATGVGNPGYILMVPESSVAALAALAGVLSAGRRRRPVQ